MTLQGKLAVVTGAASGIGRASAQAFAARGDAYKQISPSDYIHALADYDRAGALDTTNSD